MLIGIKSFGVALIRAVTLLAKFIFTVYLARVLSLEEFGIWVLVVAGIGYGVFIVGAEIFNITLRNYVTKSGAQKIGGLSKQWSIFLILYCIFIIFAILIELMNGVVYKGFLILTILILIFEHSTQEIHRIAIYSNHQIHANILLFIKSAAWMLPVALYNFRQTESITIQTVMLAWFYGSGIAAIYGIIVYKRLFKSLNFRIFVLKFQNILNYIKILMPFWILALAIRTPLVLDRYLLEIFSDRENLSVYGYYMTFGNGVQAMFDAIVVSKLIPKLMNKDKEFNSYNVKTMIRKNIMIAICFWVISMCILYNLMPYFNEITNKQSMKNYGILFIIIGLGQMVFSIGVLIQYSLYAMRRDQDLTKGAISYLISNIIMMLILIPKFGNTGAALSLGLSASIFLLFRFFQLSRV